MDPEDAQPSGLMPVASDTAHRIVDILQVVQAYAALDFSRQAAVGPMGDDLDALSAGINMLGEEIDAARRDMEATVADRTRELTLKMTELEQLNREVTELSEMSNLLQVCATRTEAFEVLGHIAPNLFVDTSGGVSVVHPSRDSLETVATWGSAGTGKPSIARRACWGLRRGRVHRSSQGGGLRCEHLPVGSRDEALCVPLNAQGETLGLLHLRWSGEAPRPALQRFAEAASERIALALANVELKAALQAQSIRDSLSGLYNRRFLDETLARELRRSAREQAPVSVLMIDIDNFKTFNDRYGHGAGDATIRQVAVLLLDGVRAEDVVCRFGGEEFAIVMAGIDAAQAAERGEAIRAAIAAAEFDWDGQPLGRVTVSIGVASCAGVAETHEELIRVADEALYEAKRRGRDQVVVAAPRLTVGSIVSGEGSQTTNVRAPGATDRLADVPPA